MIMELDTQLNVLFFSLTTGLITGILFDIYRIIRGFENPNRYLTFIEDILFWILVGLLDFIFLLYNGYAYALLYVYLLIFLGIFLYIKLFSNYFIKFENKLLNFILKLIRILFNIIIYPLELFYYNIIKKNRNNS
ncbi:spore cortex biosynthesis protein YabQ [Clostridium sediminicola]|uniref:spore cortex biosynthesis protein YabQ n=1 Tax=Clostridium sediminicola TaxID=3114879 RepID=UPI0031F1E56B